MAKKVKNAKHAPNKEEGAPKKKLKVRQRPKTME